MSQSYNKQQSEASNKIHELLLIARDIAKDAGLIALYHDLDHLDQDVQFFHKLATKKTA